MVLSLNKQKEKEWKIIIKEQAKLNGWKFNGWFAYKAIENFFYEITFYTSAYNNSINGSVGFKPLIIDERFWEIVDLNDNKRMPLSFRANGAFVISSKNVYDYNITVIPETLKADVNILLNKINQKVAELSSEITDIEKFINYIEQHPSKKSKWSDIDLLIMSFIVQKKYNKALSLVNVAKKNRGMCSWDFDDKDFYDLAIEYCQEKRSVANP
ncbi:MAG TPA: hypothetical protein VK541_22900 [Pedobacter sp.]|uniref:hypothetical protein n=1 Tax=Pedobacter sp. TaxID=1411316 RepID=UPI002B7665BE|nr:hypothetical protein [Pedobacter sp.]HMI05356.1 hypothetical protein [Pedobacter sp.]